ncbi:MAG: penicillin acylase family protein [Sediminibacterium sp.]
MLLLPGKSAGFYSIFFIVLMSFHAYGQKNKRLTIKGLHAPVEILRDKWGVNHIYAANEHDLFFAQGYCAAKDRLFQFEIWRRQATGTVAEILGVRELKRDIGTRLFQYRGDMQKELDHYHPRGKAIIQAYVEGVNTYIEEVVKHPEQMPAEFRLLQIKPGKWTPEVVISRHQGLLGNITEELNTGRAVAKVGVDKVKELMWYHPKDPLLKMDAAIQADLLNANILELYNAYRKDIAFESGDINKADEDPDAVMNLLHQPAATTPLPFEHGVEGSNNWIVSGSRTASGHAMLANDPHRKIAVPSLRYMVHLVAPGWNVIGGGEPEIPGVSIGHNESGAWGLTIYETDGEDLYVYDLNPADLSQYRYKGNWVNMKQIRETIPVKNAAAQTVTLRYTLHGPVTYIDSVHHKAYAVRCAWLEPGGAPYMASLRIDQATTWDAFRDACMYSHIPGENMIWADTKGNIGWQAVGIIPVRKNFSGLVPVPGDGRYEWAGFLPIKERPHLLNPSKGFFATANQNVTPDTYNHWDAVGYTWADPFRGNRANEVLANDARITIEKMDALQTDYLSIPARTLVPMLGSLNLEETVSKSAKQKLAEWDFILKKESVAAAIYAMWERQLMLQANKRFIPDAIKGLLTIQLSKLIGWLQNPDAKFGNNSIAGRNEFLKETFVAAVNELNSKLGSDMAQWQYGQAKYKHVTLQHPLNNIVSAAWKQKLNLGPLPRGGNGHTPGATGGTDNQLAGASFRLIVDTGDWDKAVMINTPGQSGDPASPYYRNLFSIWANDQYFPAYYSRQNIEKASSEKILLQPSHP